MSEENDANCLSLEDHAKRLLIEDQRLAEAKESTEREEAERQANEAKRRADEAAEQIRAEAEALKSKVEAKKAFMKDPEWCFSIQLGAFFMFAGTLIVYVFAEKILELMHSKSYSRQVLGPIFPYVGFLVIVCLGTYFGLDRYLQVRRKSKEAEWRSKERE